MKNNKGYILIILLAILMILLLLIPCFDTEAAGNARFTTQTVALKNKANGKTIRKVKHNTKLRIIKQGKVWARVSYKDKRYTVKKNYLNAEGLPSAKKSKAYIRKLKGRNPVRWHGRKYTYYTSRRFPVWRLPIKGLHLDKNGIWCDKDGYIVLGSSRANRAKRKVFATPFGKYGKVYDTGGVSTPGWLCDVATNW